MQPLRGRGDQRSPSTMAAPTMVDAVVHYGLCSVIMATALALTIHDGTSVVLANTLRKRAGVERAKIDRVLANMPDDESTPLLSDLYLLAGLYSRLALEVLYDFMADLLLFLPEMTSELLGYLLRMPPRQVRAGRRIGRIRAPSPFSTPTFPFAPPPTDSFSRS